jgi:hypothetical protein
MSFCRTLASARITLALLLLVLSPCQVMAAESLLVSPLDALLDPTFLASLSWKADQKIEEIVHTWPSYSGEQGFEDKLVRRQAEVEILGVKFKADYRVYKEADEAEVVFLSNTQPGNFFPKFYEWTQTKFCNSSHFIDRSTLSPDDPFRDISADWLFNAVRVQMSCGEAMVYKEYIPIMAAIRYSHKDHLEGLKTLIHIECRASRKTHTFQGKKSEEPVIDPPKTWIIDPDRKTLLHVSKRAFGKTELYSDEVIVASKQVNEGTVEFRINRFTGNYLMKGKVKKDSDDSFEEWGTCSKIEPRQKF